MGQAAMIAQQAAGHAQAQMTGIYGSVMKGVADRQLIRYNLKVNYANERQALEQITQEENRLRATNTVNIAKSGVRMEGSPIEVLAANAAEIGRKRKLTMRAFDLQNELLRVQRGQAQIEMITGIVGQVFSTAATSSDAFKYGGTSSANSNALGSNMIFGNSAGAGSSKAAQGAAVENIA